MKSYPIACFFLASIFAAAGGGNIVPEQFLFGVSTYPDLQTRAEWNRMLDQFQKAHFKVVRVSESSWGNLETAPGEYNFGWLKDYLDDVQRHGMKPSWARERISPRNGSPPSIRKPWSNSDLAKRFIRWAGRPPASTAISFASRSGAICWRSARLSRITRR